MKIGHPLTRLLLTLSLLTLLLPSPRASAQSPIPVSISSTGELGNGSSNSPSISADGRFVAFASEATNLIPDDTNGVTGIFVHDRLTGETTRVSISTNGEQANGPSNIPAISGNGRYVAFQSEAANLVPADTNGVSDIFVHDRLTGETKRVSVGINGEQANGASSNVTIAYDGRYLAYQTMASNLVRSDDNGTWDVYIYDNGVTGNVIRASVSSEGGGGNGASTSPFITASGSFVAFDSDADNLVPGDTNGVTDVFLHQRVLALTERISAGSSGEQVNQPSHRLSATSLGGKLFFVMGSTNIYQYDRQTAVISLLRNVANDGINPLFVTFTSSGLFFAGSGAKLARYDVKNQQIEDLGIEASPERPAISADGKAVVFTANNPNMGLGGEGENIYIVDEEDGRQAFTIAGRAADPLGRPLALVTVADQLGSSTRTGLDGSFWLAGYKPGSVTLTLEKEGYRIQNSVFSVQLSEDRKGLLFVAVPDKPLEEARLDLGMPYKFNRGCPDPYKGCGGPFHGFTSGYCTDLILDAYTYGAEFDIQFDLEQDARAHPEHFYRWHDARNAHDMWRFFAYSGQMVPNSAPYAPGDIVFFDWTEDGEIDHVAIVSEVDANGRPAMLLDATGKTNYNPSGLTTELEWLEFHERTARGHARWSGAYQPIIPFPATTQMLQIAASGENINLRLADNAGGAMSLTENTLPGGWYTNLIWEETASVENPLARGGQFTAEISNPTGQPAPFRLTIQLVVNGLVLGRAEASGNLPPGFNRSIPIYVTVEDTGTLQLTALPSRVPKIRAPLKSR